MQTLKRGAVIWAVVGVLLLAWLGFAAGLNAGVDSEVKEQIAQSQRTEHFYRVVAGDLTGQEPGPANRLARDLRELDSNELNSFVGDSNRYGGITEDLGFDPFDGVDCSECGPLDQEVVEDVTNIKHGHLEVVLTRVENEVDTPDKTPGPPTTLWLLWLVSLPVAAGIVYFRQRQSEESRYRDFPEERQLLAQLREAKGELPPGHKEWLALDALADQLQEQIDMRVSYKKSKTQEMKLEALTQEASNALEAIAAGNKELN